MKFLKLGTLMFMVMHGLLATQTADRFKSFFQNGTLRIDFYHTADSSHDWIALDKVYIQEGIWAGPLTHLIDPFDNGHYFIKIFDPASHRLIYSRGYNSYCGEYKTTAKALKGIKRTYHESARIPLPQQKVQFVLEKRDRANRLQPIFSQEIDPRSVDVIREAAPANLNIFKPIQNGDPQYKVDLVFVAEGYSTDEKDKFVRDLARMVDILFSHQPYKKHKVNFNVYGLYSPSQDSGCDQPTHGVFKRTAMGATFNALGLYRYMLTEENRALQDICAQVPCDTTIIMVNTSRYGGGGIYNFYCIFAADSNRAPYLFLHEFGHSFAGLADEYYTSSVAYNEFYPKGVEPMEPNITALLDPGKLKWRHLISAGVKVPTEWGKRSYENLGKQARKRGRQLRQAIEGLKKQNGDPAKISAMEKQLRNIAKESRRMMDRFFKNHPLKDKVGAFEGAGYAAKGLYRPMLDCLMFSSRTNDFCRVCEDAVLRMIKYYCGESL